MSAMRKRAVLRALLRLLLAERPDAGLIYIPRGEAGQRRLIAALLAMRPADANNPELSALLCELRRLNASER